MSHQSRETDPAVPPLPTSPRDHVAWFAQAMEQELRENDHKTGWDGLSVRWILNRLHQELGELERAIQHGMPASQVLSEAAGAGNFLMMLADRYCALEAAIACRHSVNPVNDPTREPRR